jgi:hypothetical protein
MPRLGLRGGQANCTPTHCTTASRSLSGCRERPTRVRCYSYYTCHAAGQNLGDDRRKLNRARIGGRGDHLATNAGAPRERFSFIVTGPNFRPTPVIPHRGLTPRLTGKGEQPARREHCGGFFRSQVRGLGNDGSHFGVRRASLRSNFQPVSKNSVAKTRVAPRKGIFATMAISRFSRVSRASSPVTTASRALVPVLGRRSHPQTNRGLPAAPS